jgi:5-methylcytosine-specific restriction endonuclease McrBC regulatory subunit McrC
VGHGLETEWLAHALEAMHWVSEERGLGGARMLDGLAWDLSVERVWEHWVTHVLHQLAPRLGLSVRSGSETRHPLQWRGAVQSMGALIPDAALRGRDRLVWIDAKYKAHLHLLARKGWQGLSPAVREAHRADLHQALAYAALANVDHVDTVLAYPVTSDEERARPPIAIASLVTGTRRVRLLLAGLPFGFRSSSHEEAVLGSWRELLAA